ncbi:MAG: protein NO VEIN domain-containing protein, partial [Planctomycetota bacterium]
HESLRRRKDRLEKRLAEERLMKHGAEALLAGVPQPAGLDFEDEEDFEDAPGDEHEEAEEEILDRATAARTIAELEIEIETLRRLESQARNLRRSGSDTKWTQLNSILDDPLMTDGDGNRRKLIIFTEPRDTLTFLADKIRTRLGRAEAVVEIHGGVGREHRRQAVEGFTHDKDVLVMVANDAAGEGINLQRAHLMVNYDLPWNPNRLEQRFGRIHRIGQQEVCHLWNLVAEDTREGEVYARLLEKMEIARQALGGRVYDVLGRLFEARPLRGLLLEAIRYGEQPEVKARLFQVVDGAVDRQHLLDLLADHALVHETMDATGVAAIREEMERAAARRLQPHYVRIFFLEAFRHLGGRIQKREAGRWEISRVPGTIRDRDRQIGLGEAVLDRYERVCFEKDKINQPPVAAYVCPGHPLLNATMDLVLERHRDLMKRGATLVDEADEGDNLRVLFYLEHAVQDGRTGRDGQQQVVSQRLQFVELGADGSVADGGPAPYLDYRPILEDERALLTEPLEASWLSGDIEADVMSYVIRHIVPRHVEEVRNRRLPEIDKVEHEVTARLKMEINHWDHRAQDLKAQESAGKRTRLSSANAEARASELADRLQRRLAELNKERDISALPPVVRGGALVVPLGLLREPSGRVPDLTGMAEDRARVEELAMQAVIAAERSLGFEPLDVGAEKRGYDIESRDPGTGHLRFIEVKGRVEGADTVTISRNEILYALNEPEAFILGIVQVSDGFASEPKYVRRPFQREPDFGAA